MFDENLNTQGAVYLVVTGRWESIYYGKNWVGQPRKDIMLEERKKQIQAELELLDTSELDEQEQELRTQLDAVLNQRNQILNQRKPLEEEMDFISKAEDYIESLKKEEE